MSDATPRERLEKLLRRLRSDDEAIRVHAAMRLTGPGIDAVSARPVLTEALNDTDESVRKLAAWVLARLASPEQRAA